MYLELHRVLRLLLFDFLIVDHNNWKHRAKVRFAQRY